MKLTIERVENQPVGQPIGDLSAGWYDGISAGGKKDTGIFYVSTAPQTINARSEVYSNIYKIEGNYIAQLTGYQGYRFVPTTAKRVILDFA